jgi:hypothetical protein
MTSSLLPACTCLINVMQTLIVKYLPIWCPPYTCFTLSWDLPNHFIHRFLNIFSNHSRPGHGCIRTFAAYDTNLKGRIGFFSEFRTPFTFSIVLEKIPFPIWVSIVNRLSSHIVELYVSKEIMEHLALHKTTSNKSIVSCQSLY